MIIFAASSMRELNDRGARPSIFLPQFMINRELVEGLIADAIAGTPCFVVDLKIGNANEIQVEIDSDEGVTVADCVRVSRGIEHNLDREEEDFSLKVTSPGADQPLKVWRQYYRHIGRSVKVATSDQKEIEGKLLAVADNSITIMTEARKIGKGKDRVKKEAEEIEIRKEDIVTTKILLSFK